MASGKKDRESRKKREEYRGVFTREGRSGQLPSISCRRGGEGKKRGEDKSRERAGGERTPNITSLFRRAPRHREKGFLYFFLLKGRREPGKRKGKGESLGSGDPTTLASKERGEQKKS